LKELRQTLCLEKLIFGFENLGFKSWSLWPACQHGAGCCEAGAKPLQRKKVNLQPRVQKPWPAFALFLWASGWLSNCRFGYCVVVDLLCSSCF